MNGAELAAPSENAISASMAIPIDSVYRESSLETALNLAEPCLGRRIVRERRTVVDDLRGEGGCRPHSPARTDEVGGLLGEAVPHICERGTVREDGGERLLDLRVGSPGQATRDRCVHDVHNREDAGDRCPGLRIESIDQVLLILSRGPDAVRSTQPLAKGVGGQHIATIRGLDEKRSLLDGGLGLERRLGALIDGEDLSLRFELGFGRIRCHHPADADGNDAENQRHHQHCCVTIDPVVHAIGP